MPSRLVDAPHATSAATATRSPSAPATTYGRPVTMSPLADRREASAQSVLSLQRSAGNAAVARMLDQAGGCGGGCGCGGACDDEREREDDALAGPPQQQAQRQALQRKPTEAQEAAFAFNNPGKVTHVGSTTAGGGSFGTDDPNEFVLWNYLVGKADLRPGHTSSLFNPIARWKPLLRADAGVKVKIVGSASTSGSASTASPLSVKRAEQLAAFLARNGIPKDRIETGGVGTKQPLADETTPEGMARNRRVELYLIRPMKVSDTLANAAATVLSETIKVTPGHRELSTSGGAYSWRNEPTTADAEIEGTGPPGTQVGYLQFVREDKRLGRYQPPGSGAPFALDFSRCTNPYLPCKDVGESIATFSAKPVDLQPGPVKAKGKTQLLDKPGTTYPTSVSSPQQGTLVGAEWSMEFVAVLGVREGATFTPLQHLIWRLDAVHKNPLGANATRTDNARLVAGGVPGAPATLDMARAMELQTCRFTMRRIQFEPGRGDEQFRMCLPALV